MTKSLNWLNIILPVIGIAIIALYNICEGSCAYLEGTLFGVALNYLGIFYMGTLIFTNLLKRSSLFLFLLSSGVGAELHLLGFQINNNVYCYYCLSFGAVILILFLFNFEKSKKIFITISVALGFILFSFLFKGSVTPVYAEETLLPSFGNGKIEVRLYTDYFCNPCKALEPKIEPLIIDLVKKNCIKLTFIDTPIHNQTRLYAKYFLYILNANKDFDHALRARSVLFEAANEKITDDECLEDFIKEKNIKFKIFDTKKTFDTFSNLLKEDRINSTPTCVICSEGKKDKFIGLDIVRALELLRY
jgi:hypothetical protein